MNKGSFIAVSTGMFLGGDISVRAKKAIENADIVFSIVPNIVVERWIAKLSKKHISLQPFYQEGQHRKVSYNNMRERMLGEVRKGKNVCGAFYGHAGVFALVPHITIEKAKKEGCVASLIPGVSAEASLYADLLIDPGSFGIHSYEATQFLFYDQIVNTNSYLVLWQVGLVGEHTAKTFSHSPKGVEVLISHLSKWYPLEHEAILYEAQVLPINKVRKTKVMIADLSDVQLNMETTLVIPPLTKMKVNQDVLDLLGISESLILANN